MNDITIFECHGKYRLVMCVCTCLLVDFIIGGKVGTPLKCNLHAINHIKQGLRIKAESHPVMIVIVCVSDCLYVCIK